MSDAHLVELLREIAKKEPDPIKQAIIYGAADRIELLSEGLWT